MMYRSVSLRYKPNSSTISQMNRQSLLCSIPFSNLYPDLKKAFSVDYKAAYQHWIDYGCAEGRASSNYYSRSIKILKMPILMVTPIQIIIID